MIGMATGMTNILNLQNDSDSMENNVIKEEPITLT